MADQNTEVMCMLLESTLHFTFEEVPSQDRPVNVCSFRGRRGA